MYFPYFRGKQYELICVRETAGLMAERGFVPIIEPVKAKLNGLKRALAAVNEAGGRAILIVNPHHGDHSGDGRLLCDYGAELVDKPTNTIGVLLKERSTAEEAVALIRQFEAQPIAIIHAGFPDPGALAAQLEAEGAAVATHVFIEEYCGKLYRRHFERGERVLVRDGFKRRTGRDHPVVEVFSDLHVTYPDENVAGFGDFLIVGDDYFETGGPAYAIVVHLTFIDPTKDSEMFIYHFKSDRSSTPTDPAGKFAEALQKLVVAVRDPNTHILRTSAVEGFLELHERQHFPGLGSVKKLSMNHHIETLAQYGPAED